MGDVRRSDSKGDINNLLDDIRGIVHDNKQTLASLKAIKAKNDEVAKTKKRVDIPSIVSGKKKSEIDIPHKRVKAGEHRHEINKRSNYTNHEEPDDCIPTISLGTILKVESAPPPVFPSRDESNERRKSRREKSTERKRKIDAIRQKTYDRKDQDPTPPRENPRRGRELTRPSPVARPRRPLSSEGPPTIEVGSCPTEKSEAPPTRRTSGRRSPQRTRSPRARSPRTRSPRTRSPRTRSPRTRSPRTRSPEPPRNRTPSGSSDWGSHNHLYRIRKDSEGSVEIFPEFVEEDYVVSEYKERNGSLGDLYQQDPPARPGVSPGRSLPRSTPSYSQHALNKLYAKAGSNSPLKRRIVLEKCPDCDEGDSPPEIEIRICKRDKCGRYRSENDIDIVTGPALSLYTTPDAPQRSSSYNRIPHTLDIPSSPTATRTRSPSSVEVERMTRRLQQLKQEVDNVIKECELENIPISISRKPRKRLTAFRPYLATDSLDRPYKTAQTPTDAMFALCASRSDRQLNYRNLSRLRKLSSPISGFRKPSSPTNKRNRCPSPNRPRRASCTWSNTRNSRSITRKSSQSPGLLRRSPSLSPTNTRRRSITNMRGRAKSPDFSSLRKNSPVRHSPERSSSKTHKRNNSYEILPDGRRVDSRSDIQYTFSKPKSPTSPRVTICRDFVGSPEVSFSPINTRFLIESPPPHARCTEYAIVNTPDLFEELPGPSGYNHLNRQYQ